MPTSDDAASLPDLVDHDADGRPVLGYNAPAWGADAERRDELVAWAVRTAHAAVQAVDAGEVRLPDGASASDGYDIAFISAYDEPDEVDDLVLQLGQALEPFNARAVWMVHDPDAGSRLRRANDDLAAIVQPLAHEGRGILLWATLIGEFRDFGLNHYNPRTQTSLPYEGEVPASLERAIVAHKRAYHDATGQAWVSLRALYQPDDLPPLVQTDVDDVLPWTPIPDGAWDAERRLFPKR